MMDAESFLALILNIYLIGQDMVFNFLHSVYLLIHFIIASGIHFIPWNEENGPDATITDKFKDEVPSTSKQMKESSDSALTHNSYRAGWVVVNGVSSHVLTWGGWVEGPPPDGESIILFMCGVPGIPLFYHKFLETLYGILGIPIWTISMAGHELPPSSNQREPSDEPKFYNNVKAQIDHKMAFIKSYVPCDRKIYLIGHSFGAKMVTELLKDEQISEKMQKCLLLMPTLERFKDTPRAQLWLILLYSGCVYLLALCIWILSVLPVSWRKEFFRFYFQFRGMHQVSQCCHDAMLQFCQPSVFKNVRTLVWDEFKAIQQLDIEILSKYSDKIKVYFAMKDHWAPLTHYKSLKAAVPDLSVELLDNKFKHAFTLDTAEDMAVKLVNDLAFEHKNIVVKDQ